MGIRYPSQYEAQLILDVLDALDGIHTGYAENCNTARHLRDFRLKYIQPEVEAVFNSPDSSPWEIVIKRDRRDRIKRELRWRRGWLEKEEQG